MSLGGSSNDPEKLGSCVKILSWLRKKRSMRVHFWRYVPFLHYVSCFFPKRPVNLHRLFLFWKHWLICDHEEKWVQNMGCKKQGAKHRVIATQKDKRQCKKQGHCYFKKTISSHYLFSFWVTMTLFFAPCFLQPIFWTLYLKFQNLKNLKSTW